MKRERIIQLIEQIAAFSRKMSVDDRLAARRICAVGNEASLMRRLRRLVHKEGEGMDSLATAIQLLLYEFTKDELVSVFGFDADVVELAEAEILNDCSIFEEKEWELCV